MPMLWFCLDKSVTDRVCELIAFWRIMARIFAFLHHANLKLVLQEYVFHFRYDVNGKVSMKFTAEERKLAGIGAQVKSA